MSLKNPRRHNLSFKGFSSGSRGTKSPEASVEVTSAAGEVLGSSDGEVGEEEMVSSEETDVKTVVESSEAEEI